MAQKNIGKITLAGSSIISRLVVILSSLYKGISNIKNISKSNEINNLITILKQFGINIIENNDIIMINGKNISSWEQPENIINIESSFDTLSYILSIISSNKIRTFITGNSKFIKNNLNSLKYLQNNNNLFFKNEYRLPLMTEGKMIPLKNNQIAENIIKKNSLIFHFFTYNKDCVILDKEVNEEYLEQLLRYSGVEIKETIIDNKHIFTKNIKKSKEIFIQKTDNKISGKDFTIPVDIEEAFYTIFIGLLLNVEEFYIENVSVNDLNCDITKILIDNGVNLEFRNQKILNGIKVVDFYIKRSILKPITVSKNRLENIMNLYPALIILNILKYNELKLVGLKGLKNTDSINYNYLIKTLKSINVSFTENKDILEISCNNISLSNGDIVLDNLDNIDKKVILPLFLSNIALSKNVFKKNNLEDIKNIFPNLLNVLEQFNMEIIYDN